MKRNIIKLLMAQLMLLCAISANALEFSVDGIRYKTNGNEASVTSGGTYSGNVIIPSTVTYNGVTYSVTSIGDYAFYNCTGLTKITIPESVTSICEAAFHGCTGLSSVNIVDLAAWCRISFEYYDISYSYYTSNPLRYAHHLYLNGSEVTNLIIPESVTAISAYAFYGCTELTSVTIPNSVTTIGGSAFYACSVLSNVTIPNSVTSIGNYAFAYCSALTTINIPELVTYIGEGAFKNCTSLVTLNYNAISCADFDNSNFSISQYLPFQGLIISTINIGDCVQQIPAYFANGLNNLTNLNIPESVTSIRERAFCGCSGLTGVIVPNSVTTIGNSAFASCSGLTSVSIGNSVTSIGDYAFGGCTGLTRVSINDLAAWCRINFINSSTSNPLSQAHHLYLNGSEIINLEIPYTVTNIGRFAFCGCTEITNLTIPEPVTSIDGSAFLGCTALETLNYNAVSCADLGGPTFGNSISTINIGNRVQRIPSYFANGLSKMNSITIPESVTSIGERAFYDCSGLTSVNIPESITSIRNYAFWGCTALETLNYNAVSCANFDVNWSPFRGLNISTINIGNSVQMIPANFAYRMGSLTNITIPESVTTIGNGAFSGCTGLTSVNIPESVTSIGGSAFSGCTGLTSVNIPESVTSIGGSAFDGCVGLTSVNITDIAAWCRINFSTNTSNPLSQAHHLYLNGSEVINLVIPNSVTSIGNYAFYCCTGLTSVTLPSSITSINDYVFHGCTGLINAKLPKTLKSIGNYALSDCSSLVCVTIPNSVTTIGNYAFSSSGLSNISIPNSVTTIGNSAFRNCSGLKSATITSYLTSLGDYAFYNCSDLSAFTCMPETPPIFENSNSFSSFNTTSLYVPRSGIENYKTHTNWRRFAKIYEFVGYFSVPDVNVSKGKTVVVPVSMTNEADIIGFQTDIYLPEGFEFVKDGNDYVVDPSDRMAHDHSIMCNVSEDGALRVLCYSPTNKVISGNEGELFYVTIKAPNDTVGDFSLWFKNTIFTTSDAEELLSPDASTNLNVIPYLPGDANENGEVSVIDIVTAAQYIIFQNPDPFIFEAADLNNDEQITVTDLALIANLILYPTKSAPKHVPSIDLSIDQIYGNDIHLNAGDTQIVNINLDNAEKYSAYQMDLKLPSGIIASNFKMTNQSDGHSLITSEETDGMIRVLCYSPSLTSLGNDDKSLLTFDVTSTGNIVGDIVIDGIEVVTTTCQPVHLDALAIGVNKTNSVSEVSCDKSAAHIGYYNLAGQKQVEPAKGVTIIVTTYTDGSRFTQKVIM